MWQTQLPTCTEVDKPRSLLGSTAGAQDEKKYFGVGPVLSLGATVSASEQVVKAEDTFITTWGAPSTCMRPEL